MKKITLALLAAGFAVTAACSASTAKPIPQASNVDQTTATTAAKAATTTTAKKVSTCDAVREALLTGTQPQINAAMTGLQADTTADATAREYADYYLHRDATGPYSAQMREMDIGLIRSACS